MLILSKDSSSSVAADTAFGSEAAVGAKAFDVLTLRAFLSLGFWSSLLETVSGSVVGLRLRLFASLDDMVRSAVTLKYRTVEPLAARCIVSCERGALFRFHLVPAGSVDEVIRMDITSTRYEKNSTANDKVASNVFL